MQCSLLAALYAGEDDNSMAGISLTLAKHVEEETSRGERKREK